MAQVDVVFQFINQGLLNAIQVSTPELEKLVRLARDAGALGAKLTGGGGGVKPVALVIVKDDLVKVEPIN